MKREIIITSMFLLSIILVTGFVYAENECTKNSDCRLDNCSRNCVNLTYQKHAGMGCAADKGIDSCKCSNGVCQGLEVQSLVGNDSDEHGCKASAGYSWCEEKKKCLRVWEENCSSINPPIVGNDSDEHGCKASAGYQWCDKKQKCLRIWEENCSSINLPGQGKSKILPETASLRARERLGELGFNITLKEVPDNNKSQNKTVYIAEAEKQGKIFGLFKAKAKVSAEIDAETGEVIKVRKPWWSFIAGI